MRRRHTSAASRPAGGGLAPVRPSQPSLENAAREATRHDAELRRLAVEEERLAHGRRGRAEARAPRFMPSTRSPGLSLDSASPQMSVMLVNAGGPATVVEAVLRPELGGAYPGGVAAVFGSGTVEDPLGRVPIDHGVDLLVRFGHAALGALADTSQPLILELRSVDDDGFETTETLVLRREGKDIHGRDLWPLRPEESRRSTAAVAR